MTTPYARPTSYRPSSPVPCAIHIELPITLCYASLQFASARILQRKSGVIRIFQRVTPYRGPHTPSACTSSELTPTCNLPRQLQVLRVEVQPSGNSDLS